MISLVLYKSEILDSSISNLSLLTFSNLTHVQRFNVPLQKVLTLQPHPCLKQSNEAFPMSRSEFVAFLQNKTRQMSKHFLKLFKSFSLYQLNYFYFRNSQIALIDVVKIIVRIYMVFGDAVSRLETFVLILTMFQSL